MNRLEIKGKRVRLGLTQNDVAVRLGVSLTRYISCERGITKFTDFEKGKLKDILGLTFREYNEFLYDGALREA